MEKKQREKHNILLNAFKDISKLINDELDVEPIMFGILGLQDYFNIYLKADIINILIPDEYVNGSKKQEWLLFLSKYNYKLEDNNIFSKDNIKYTYDSFLKYQKLGNIDLFYSIGFYDTPEDLITDYEKMCEYIKTHNGYYVFTPEQYLDIYKSLNDEKRIEDINLLMEKYQKMIEE